MDTAELDRTSYLIIESAIEIHRRSDRVFWRAYIDCMIYELLREGSGWSEVGSVRYKDLVLDGFYRLDLLVNDAVVVELKAVEAVHPVHRAQVLSI